MAFPAPSGGGKSTPVAACLLAGWEYLSGEALCLDWVTGDVLAYPRPVGLSGWSRARLGLSTTATATVGVGDGDGDGGEVFLPARRFGARVAAGPLRLAHLVLPERGLDLAVDPLPRRAGVAALLTRSFNHWRDPGRAFDLAHEVVAPARVWRLRLGDPHGAAVLLDRVLCDPAAGGSGGQPGCRDTSDR